MNEETWSGNVLLLKKTRKALLVNHEGEESWIPLSVIHDDSCIWEKSDEGEEGELVIPLWLAENERWA